MKFRLTWKMEVKMRKYVLLLTVSLLVGLVHSFGQSGPVAHWSFNEVNNNVITDHSGNGNHGTNYGAEIIDGVIGNALSFDGVDDYARIPGDGMNAPAILSTIEKGSLSIWFRVDYIPTQIDGIAPIFYYGSEENCDFFDAANKGFIVEVGHTPLHNGSERLYYTVWTNGCTFPSLCYDSNHAIEEGEWYHFVVIIGENYNTGYLNGVEMADRRYNFGTSNDAEFFGHALVHEKLWLGKGYWDDATMHYDGAIDEIKIYDRVLSEFEIQNLYEEATLSADGDYIKEPSKMQLYPNPGNNYINIGLPETWTDLRWRILDLSGRLMLSNYTVGNDQLRINISTLKSGVYVLETTSDDQIIRKRFIVQ